MIEVKLHKPKGLDFEFDLIPSIRFSYHKTMNNFWYMCFSWLLWGLTIRKRT